MRNLKELNIEAWLGRNTKFDPSDSKEHQAQTITNFEVSAKGGVLTKSLGNELATDVLGANYITANKLVANGGSGSALTVIYNIWEWRVNSTTKYIICSAKDSTNDRLWYWDNTNSYWQILDDDIGTHTFDYARFYNRNDAMIVTAGTGATNYPLHIKNYEARTIFGAKVQAAGIYDTKNILPFSGFYTDSSVTEYTSPSDNFLNGDAIIYYYAVLVYDDGQYGNVSKLIAQNVNSSGNTSILKLKLKVWESEVDTMGRRVTAVAVFRSLKLASSSDDGADAWNPRWAESMLLATVNFDNEKQSHVNASAIGTLTLSTKHIDGLNSVDSTTNAIPIDVFKGCYVVLVALNGDGTEYIKEITSNTNDDLVIADTTDLSDGSTYNYDIISYWSDDTYIVDNYYECFVIDMIESLVTPILELRNYSEEDVPQYNYEYVINHHNKTIVAPIYDTVDEELHSNWIGVSNINGDGNYEYDVLSNIINLSDMGIISITGLGRILDYIIVFSDNDIVKINMASGSVFNWSLEETLQDVGCVAKKSLVYIAGDEFKHSGYYYVSRDGFRVYDGYKSVLLSLPIEDIDNYPINTTSLTEAVSTYNDRLKQWWISFPTDEKIFKFDLRTGEWLDYSGLDEMDAFTLTVDQELLGTDGDKLVVFDNDGSANLTDFDGTDIAPVWKSKIYNMESSSMEKQLHELTLRYRSDTAVTFQFYVNKGSAESLLGTEPFPASTTMNSVTIGFPLGVRGYEFEFGISLGTTEKTTNTYLEVENCVVRFKYNQSERG